MYSKLFVLASKNVVPWVHTAQSLCVLSNPIGCLVRFIFPCLILIIYFFFISFIWSFSRFYGICPVVRVQNDGWWHKRYLDYRFDDFMRSIFFAFSFSLFYYFLFFIAVRLNLLSDSETISKGILNLCTRTTPVCFLTLFSSFSFHFFSNFFFVWFAFHLRFATFYNIFHVPAYVSFILYTLSLFSWPSCQFVPPPHQPLTINHQPSNASKTPFEYAWGGTQIIKHIITKQKKEKKKNENHFVIRRRAKNEK